MFRSMLVFCVVMWLRGVGTVFADEPPTDPWDEEKIFDTLTRATHELSGTDFGKSEEGALNLINERAKFLFEHFNGGSFEGPQAGFAREYLWGLTLDAWEMKNVAAAVKAGGVPDPERWSEKIADVMDDLNAKAGLGRHTVLNDHGNYFVQPTYGYETQRVELIVTTFDKDGKEVQNCEIWFVLKGWANYKDRYDHFDKPSSPASRDLPPGNYVVWTRMGSAEGAQVPLKDLGIDGQKSRAISIPAP